MMFQLLKQSLPLIKSMLSIKRKINLSQPPLQLKDLRRQILLPKDMMFQQLPLNLLQVAFTAFTKKVINLSQLALPLKDPAKLIQLLKDMLSQLSLLNLLQVVLTAFTKRMINQSQLALQLNAKRVLSLTITMFLPLLLNLLLIKTMESHHQTLLHH
jgi:hypothetical protein